MKTITSLLTALSLLSFAPHAEAGSSWSSWSRIQSSHVLISTKHNSFDYGNGDHEIYWKFKNDGSTTVKFTGKVKCIKDDGTLLSSYVSENLSPGKESYAGGSWCIGSDFYSVEDAQKL